MSVKSVLIGGLALWLAAAPHCAPPGSRYPVIKVDGSSTVYPLAEAVAEEFQLRHPGVRVTIGVSGTGGGMKKFCRGETDVATASRPIAPSEREACRQAGLAYYELPIAMDAIVVVTHPRNAQVSAVTLEELRRMWSPEAQGRIRRWSDINPAWGDRPLNLYGAGTDSGTFDYFTEVVNGKARASRGDYMASEDDNVLVQGIAGDLNALGYFGFDIYYENRDKLRALPIVRAAGQPPVTPTVETILAGDYAPLARPLFVYVNARAMDRPEVATFVHFWLEQGGKLAEEVHCVPLPPDAYAGIRRHLDNRRVGTIFDRRPAVAISIQELLTLPAVL
ncbi:MAG: PstS family phosphate ABC transporter substrate-binding protein [Chloracidobacterium sp.]|uniref:Phosphate-binding protein n=1 Tax=Chloracidobacterium validum TaxID=2821543 RepID=A0ABX8B4W3_9BACT|nr:PstS family phosphate ABC transporter substrate-binding protein [Chloracidobacterium validum]QUW02018.1 PstS family phosphate ABC transporter substrate-binding protein [Chloracidobacterium validum]